MPTLSLTLQPRPKLIYSQCAYGPGQCQLSVCMGNSNGPLLAYSSKWPAQTQAGSLPTCPMDPEQAMAQVDKATYVPMAMICACTAAQAPAD